MSVPPLRILSLAGALGLSAVVAASPTTAGADPTGDALARRVLAATGDVYAVSSLTFTFVVQAGETEKARRTHTWDRDAGTVDVRTGDTTVRIQGLHQLDPSAAVADPEAHAATWAQAAPSATPAAAARAWSAWINDSYWLLAAGKVMDDGVSRSVDAEGRLVLTFDGVGVTPGDRYMLTVDPETDRVVAWDFVLQSGQKGRFLWTDHRAAGPLTLSHHRATEAGDFVIRFEDVSATP